MPCWAHCKRKTIIIFRFVTVKEQPVQEYLTDSSGILGQINLKTLNNVHAIAPNIFAITFIKK